MELVPILSLIVLVATIGTFILAVWAYIMFKVRERKGASSSGSETKSIEAEVVAPAEVVTREEGASSGSEHRVYRPEQKMMKYTSEGYVPISSPKSGESNKWR